MNDFNYWMKRIGYLVRKNLFFQEIKAVSTHSSKIEPEKILPLVSIEDLAPDIIPKLINTNAEDGNVSAYELECISKLIKANNPKTIFEIGTFNGLTTLHLAVNSNPETRIHTLDLPENEVHSTKLRIKSGDKKFILKQKSGVKFIGTEYENRITQIYSDSAKYDYSAHINKIDFVFIDGSHSYEYVLNDTEIAFKLLRNSKGVILWHDYSWREVVQALNEFFQNDKRFSNLKQIKGTSFGYIKYE